MSFITLLWLLIGAWLTAIVYYWTEIRKYSGGKSGLFFSMKKLSSEQRIRTKRVIGRIWLATVLFIVAVFIAYFVKNSS